MSKTISKQIIKTTRHRNKFLKKLEMIKKHIISKLFCISVLSLSSCNFIKKGTLAQMFSCEFCEFFKNSFLYRTPPVAASEKRKHIYLEGWHYETFKVLYTFFSDFVSTLVIKEYAKCDPISKSNTGQVILSTVNYINHSSILMKQ